MLPCVFGSVGTPSPTHILAVSQATPFGLTLYGTIMETERFLLLTPFFVCDFPDAQLDTTLIKKLAEIGAQKKERFCVGVGM